MRIVLVIASIACSLALVGGCFIFTGSTDGYQLIDSGQPETSVACSGDAECVALTCVSASDCAAGEVCCLGASPTSLASSCQVGPCAQFQLCNGNSECGDSGETCASEQCSSSGVSLTLQSCTPIPGCAH